jgi:hypothetical protein
MAKNKLAILFSNPLAHRTSRPNGALVAVQSLDWQKEKNLLLDAIQEGCQESGQEIHVRIDPATADSMRTLVTLGCHAIHFTGHGSPDFLCFEDGRGGVHPLPVLALKQLFIAGGSADIKLVFVGACNSRPAGQVFAEAGVPHVVAVERLVREQAAFIFTRAFYLALISGKTVQQSFEIGKAAVACSPDGAKGACGADQFLLLPEDKDHDEVIFRDDEVSGKSAGVGGKSGGVVPTREGSMHDVTKPPPPNNLPTMPSQFVGRTIELYKLLQQIRQHRLVNVVGAFGMGKSALAIAAAGYNVTRRT